MNKLYTLSYFRNRLFAAGIESKILIKNYPENDTRYWTICLFKDYCIYCTCYKYDSESYSFEFWDGGNLIHNRKIIKTLSMNIIIKSIFSWISKSSSV